MVEVGFGRRSGWGGEIGGTLEEVEESSYLDVMLRAVLKADLSEAGFLFRRAEASLNGLKSELFRAPLSFPFIVEDLGRSVYGRMCSGLTRRRQSLSNGDRREGGPDHGQVEDVGLIEFRAVSEWCIGIE